MFAPEVWKMARHASTGRLQRKNVVRPVSLAVALLLVAKGAAGFSLDTHLYIGTKVLDDALTGSISICTGEALATAVPGSRCARRYAIPEAVLASIKSNPSAYLSGTLGPDVFPDLITSQVTIHPGIEHGWGTDNFLQHLLANAGAGGDLAWVSGFLSHASADVFAHSWVNLYAGGLFDLANNLDSNEIEERHFILERYIADRTPSIWSKYAAMPEAPHEFVADQLILSNPVAAQLKKTSATGHVIAVEVLHENVQKFYEDALDLAKRINAIAAPHLAPLEVAKAQLKASEEALKLANKGLAEGENALKEVGRLINEAERTLADVARVIDQNPGLILGWRQQIAALNVTLDAQESALEGLRDVAKAAERAFSDANNALARLCNVGYACYLVPGYGAAKEAVNIAKKSFEAKAAVLNGALKAIEELKKQRDAVERSIRDAEKAIADARITQGAVKIQMDALRLQRDAADATVKAARKTIDETTKLVQQAQTALDKLSKDLAPITDLLARYNPIVLFLQHWAADLRRASIAFSRASQEVAASIIEKKGGNALERYIKWHQCWGPVLVAIPSEVPQTACTAKDIYTQMSDKLNEEMNKVVDRLGSLGWLIAPQVKISQEFEKKIKKPLEGEIKKSVRHVGAEITTFLANRQLANLLELMSSKERITDGRLNRTYETDDSRKKLLEIPDVAARVRIDAGLAAEGDTVSEDRFPALHNAIVLSKLALLDADGLNAVFNDLVLEVNPQHKPKMLFNATNGKPFNVLLNAITSIDGNQQWQAVGLPYPVSSGSYVNWPGKSQFGRPGQGGAHSAFVLWGDVEARNAGFKQLFRGPMNPGLESHPAMVSYRFPSCDRHPFPSTTGADGRHANEDLTCRLMSAKPGVDGNYPALAVRVVKTGELSHLSRWELRLARNEIFARHGYAFGPTELQKHFAGQQWYKPVDAPARVTARRLSSVEWTNIARIQRREKQLRRAGVRDWGGVHVAAGAK